MAARPMKLGMLGLWHTHADGMVRQIVTHPDEFQLIGVFDEDDEVMHQRRKDWDVHQDSLRFCTRTQELLERPLDGVIVEGRVSDNVRLTELALHAGFSVMMEKPAGENLQAFQNLLAYAHAHSLHVQMTYLFRYMSAVLEMLRMAREGEFGEIYQVRIRLPKDYALYDEYVRDLGCYSGGIFFEMAGHAVDMMVAMLGAPMSVHPFMAHHQHLQDSPTFIDNGISVLQFEKAWGIIEVTALEVAPDSRRIEVFGTEGACVITHLGSGHLKNDPVQPIHVYKNCEASWVEIPLPAASLQISDLREFFSVLHSEKEPDYSCEHDLIVQETLLRACASW